jgi:hypothetical protein
MIACGRERAQLFNCLHKKIFLKRIFTYLFCTCRNQWETKTRPLPPLLQHLAPRVDVLQTSPRRFRRLDSPPVGGGRTIHLKGGSQERTDQKSNVHHQHHNNDKNIHHCINKTQR